jgi:signal transduction histidine kinase/class 3 adenylate cyclase
MATGQECCEWTFTWEEPRRTWNPAKVLARWVLQNEIEDQKVSFQSQYDELNHANVELQDRKAKLEESAAALAHQVEQLTALHEAGIAFTSARNYTTLVHKALQAIINILHYDRAMINRYDRARQVAYDAHLINVPEEVARFANSMEVPVTDPQSIEGQVLLQRTPLLLDDIHHQWHRLHPLNQELVNLTDARSFISVPLTGKDGVLGSLTVDRKEGHALKQDDLNLMVTLANQLALALENVDAYREIEALNVGLESKVQTRTAELEAANDRLKELDRLKTEFFNNLNHELRTPLTLSMGAFKSLFKNTSLSPEARRWILTGYENSKILLDLINDLLKLAKLDSGHFKLQKRCFDLNAFLRGIASNFEVSGKDRLHLKDMTGVLPIEADPRQLKAVFYNLFANGLKFSDPLQGQVRVTLRLQDNQVLVSIQDNGIGIPHEQLDRIFERFTQVEGSSNRRFEGTGIGLALAKEIVTLHGGHIAVQSELGRGATFTVRLPQGSAREENLVNIEDPDTVTPLDRSGFNNPEGSLEVPFSPATVDKPFVIVAEDNADMRNYLVRILLDQYRVEAVENGFQAFEKAKRFQPDLILTDVMMPRMSGYDLLKAIRSEKTLCTTPIIFLTARADEEERLQGLEKGADDYVTKPFNDNEVLARVHNLIRARKQERELRELREQKLTRFLPRHLAELVLEGNADEFLKGHRREITVLFIDLRGFTAYAETAEPEELQRELRNYQLEMGKLIFEFHGTLERFTGDSIMVFFNDPLPVPNHTELALSLALAMRERIKKLCLDWRDRNIPLGAGIGIASGFATLGLMGFDERVDYAAIGPVANLAARLCDVAKNEQILIPQSLFQQVEEHIIAEPLGKFLLKGIPRKVSVYNVTGLRADSETLLEFSPDDHSPLQVR